MIYPDHQFDASGEPTRVVIHGHDGDRAEIRRDSRGFEVLPPVPGPVRRRAQLLWREALLVIAITLACIVDTLLMRDLPGDHRRHEDHH